MNDLVTQDQPDATSTAELLTSALIDSRQRWRELINLSADFAFETDEWGRFTLIAPDPALGWSAQTLIGQPSSLVLADGDNGSFNPFRATAKVRHRQAWMKRSDGGAACLTFCAAPIRDAMGRLTGVRGSGSDMTEQDGQAAQVAAALRRAEVLDHILWRMGQEVLAPSMMEATLSALASAMGGEGAAVLLLLKDGLGPRLAHVAGAGGESAIEVANRGLMTADDLAGVRPVAAVTADGKPVLMAACQTKAGERAGLVTWRSAGSRTWDREDSQLLVSTTNIVRMVLEHDSIQHEMSRQARTDSLTGLLNRRAFLEEAERHIGRLDRESQPGTLIFADLDHFKPVNDRLGHEMGDLVLKTTAGLLRRTFRPGDLVARLGGDEFAVWLNGADHMTAAERAEYLRDQVPEELAAITGPDGPRLSLSIGIACREPGDNEPLDSVIRRADTAMYAVKNGGRGHWRVSLRRRS